MAALLEGYAHVEPPCLPACRFPSNDVYTTPPVPLAVSSADSSLLRDIITASIGRVVSIYCASNDVAIGTQDAGGELEGLIRLTWDNETTWCALLDTLAEARASGIPSTASAIQSLGLDKGQYPSPAVCHFGSLPEPQNAHPITFCYLPDDCTLHLNASQAYLHPTVADQILEQVAHIVSFASDNLAAPVSHLPRLGDKLMSLDERLADDEIQSAYTHGPVVTFAPDYLRLKSEDMPQHVAIQWCDDLSLQRDEQFVESITFMELHRKANKVAHWLVSRGLQPEDRVSLCFDRNLDFHACLFGVMRAGGCYIPIDPELPAERKLYIVKDSETRFVFTSGDPVFVTAELPGVSVFDVSSQDVQSEISLADESELSNMTEEGLAYLLYTSGTTGNPKGCLLTHRGLAQAALALSSEGAKARLSSPREGKYLAVASIAFDVHLAEIFIPLILGMPLLCARRSQLFENLPAYVDRLKISHLGIVPSLIEATLNAASSTEGQDFALRFVASGGEKMSDSILDKWGDHENVMLGNFYGPSEVTIGCASRIMTSSTPRANIGRVFRNVSAYVVDGDMNILPRGGMGELVVEGPLVGRGYQGRPDLTEKVFMKWPTPESWAYRTGDLVRMMPDSTLEIMGRIDTQIKLRGVRIESEGVSAIVRGASSNFSGVSLDAVTILARHEQIGSDQLVTFFVWDHTIGVATRKSRRPYLVRPPEGLLSAIRSTCEAQLPSYMRPSHLVPLSWLPLSSNGKVDTKIVTNIFLSLSLESIRDLSGPQERQEEDTTCSDQQRAVFDLIRQHAVMPFTQAFPGLDIFQCGMDSMAVIRFTTALRSHFGRSITAPDVLKARTVAGIASALSKLPPITSTDQRLRINLLPPDITDEASRAYGAVIEHLYPPFSIQPGVLARSAHLDHLYVQHVILACQSSTTIDRLRVSWNALVASSPILRTVFYISRDLVQVVLNAESVQAKWGTHVAASSDPDEFADTFLREHAVAISQDINRNISQIPPHRVSLWESPTSTFFVLSIHHALYDGISLSQLLVDLEAQYQEQSPSAQPPLDNLFSYLAGVDRGACRKFWDETFLHFPWPVFDLRNDPSTTPRRHQVNFKESLSSLQKLASFQGVTIQSLLTTTYAYFVAKDVYFSTDVVFGVLRSGRLIPVPNVDTALLPLLSLVPFRVNLSTPQNLLRRVQDLISGMVEHEHVPLSQVQGWQRGAEPLFETLFSCSTAASHESSLWTLVESAPPRPDFPLALEAVQDHNCDSLLVRAIWTDPKLDSKVRRWLEEFEQMAQTLATSAATVLSELQSCSVQRLATPLLRTPATQPRVDTGVSSPLHDTIRRVVSEFMQTPSQFVLPMTSFFSLGLDSIKSVGLSRALSEEGFKISSLDILRNATLDGLVDLVHRSQSSGTDRQTQGFDALCAQLRSELDLSALKLSPDDRVDVFPASALQSGMLSQTIGSEGSLYNHVFSFNLEVGFRAEAVENSWKVVSEKLAILRTTFHFLSGTGRWVQVVHSDARLQWSSMTLSTSQTYREALNEFLHEKELASVDTFSIPPFRLRLFSFADGGAKLAMVMHHALYDGLSIDKLFRTVETVYRGKDLHEFSQYQSLLPTIISQEEEGTRFWVERLKEFEPKRLKPIRTPSNPSDTPSYLLERSVSLQPGVLKKFVERHGVGVQCIGQAAFAIALARKTGSNEVTFGHTVSGRTLPGAEEVIGPVLNTIPCCTRVGRSLSNLHVVRTLHQWNLDSLDWQHSSIRTIQRQLGKSGLWDALFLFQPTSAADDDTLWSVDTSIQVSDVSVQYPINLEVYQKPEGFTLKVAIRSDFFSHSDSIDFVESLCATVSAIVERPDDLALVKTDSTLRRSPSSDSTKTASTVSEGPPKTPSLKLSSKHLSIITSTANAPPSSLSPDTPISSLGIDSITAIQIIAKFKDVGLRLSVKDILDEQTIGGMLSKLVEIPSETTSSSHPVIDILPTERDALMRTYGYKTSTIESILPSSSGMSWLTGAWQKSRGTRFQHVFPFRVADDVDLNKLRFAWRKLTDRHPILRSTVATTPEGVTRIVTFHKEDGCNWLEEFVDSNVFFKSLLERMKLLVSQPPTSDTPPTRAILYRCAEQAYLLIYMSHFQYDAWSLQLLLHDLSCIYHGTASDVSGDLRGFVEASQVSAQAREGQRRYWTRLLSTQYKPTLFPSLREPGTPVPSSRIICTEKACILDAARSESEARSRGVTLQSVFLAAWAKIQSEYTKGDYSTFGLWANGRMGSGSLDMAKLALPCMNIVPMHVPGTPSAGVLELARLVQAQLRERSPDVDQTSHEDLVRWAGTKGKPLFNVFVNIVKTAVPVKMSTWVVEPVRAPYFVPDHIEGRHRLLQAEHLNSTSHTIQDDVFIDIATLDADNTILMSLDIAPHIMDEEQGRMILSRWASEVREALGLS